jgi:hypothetical protein
MTIIFALINLILIIAAVVSLVWTVVGIPVGLFFIYQYFTTKKSAYKKKLPKRIILSFLGILLFLLLPVLWVVIDILSAMLGGNILQQGFGGIKTLPPVR